MESKRVFPPDWSDEKILAAVESTAADPMNVVIEGQFVIRYREIDTVIVRVTSSHFPLKREGAFDSGAPHSGDGVTINKSGKRVKMPLDRSVLWE